MILHSASWLASALALVSLLASLASRGRVAAWQRAALTASLLLIVSGAGWSYLLTLASLPAIMPQQPEWLALLLAAAATLACLADADARFPVAHLYALALAALAWGEIARSWLPVEFFIWGALCELTGFLVIAAALGWATRKWERPARWLPGGVARWSQQWFLAAQALLFIPATIWTVWIAVDLSFEGVGREVALLGIVGRREGPIAALMLTGAAILMAWQTRGRWRAAWQYTAFAAFLLCTSSTAWLYIDPASSAQSRWLDWSGKLAMTASMMTLMTGWGLGRFLPDGSDWVPRARRAMPTFAGLALLMLLWALAQSTLR